MPHWIKGVMILITVTLISGCATSTEHILAQNGPTMAQLIRANHTDQHTNNIAQSRRVTDRESLAGYTRTPQNEINQLFPTLDNPTITIYVYPHLSTTSGAPVPGYTTAIKLYPADVYALPGERVMTQ